MANSSAHSTAEYPANPANQAQQFKKQVCPVCSTYFNKFLNLLALILQENWALPLSSL